MTENNTPSTNTTPAATGIDSGEGDLFDVETDASRGVRVFTARCRDCGYGTADPHRPTAVTDCQAHGQQAHGWSLGVVAGVGVTAARGGHPNAAQVPPAADNTDLDGDGADTEPERERFVPGYAVSDRRILRARLAVSATDGTATVTFRGQVANGLDCWVEQGTSGRLSLYAEVAVDDTTATSITVAVVPTGKRTPDTGARLGSVGGQHVYLLSIDGSVDRAELDADFEARKAAKAEARAAAQAAQVGNPFGFGGF